MGRIDVGDSRAPCVVRAADWARDGGRIAALRTAVFVHEQRVPPDEEYDGRDAESDHVIAELEDGTVIGTGRLLPEGRIGRMAVDRAWRGAGVGRALLDALIARAAERGFARVELNAQTAAMEFYRRAGFEAFGPEFMEAGIPHRRMERDLASGGSA